MKRRLLLIGPDVSKHGLGGVTIHVLRLRQYLDNNNYDYGFLDYKYNSIWTLLKSMPRYDLIHFHISNPILLFILVCYCRLCSKKVLVTLHGDYGRFGRLKNWMVKSVIKMAAIPIVINKKSYTECKCINDNTTLIPAFIPPQKSETLPDDLVSLITGLRDDGKTIFSTNASNVSSDKYGNDIYGIEFLVQNFKDSQNSVLIVSDPSGNYRKQYHNLISDSVYFIDYPHSYYEVLKFADCSIRNTSTDGDSLSIKEALCLGVPVICTDVVDRPDGVTLFKYCDQESFAEALHKYSKVSKKLENGADMVMQLYKSILK